MRALAVAALCCLLAACGGDESSSSGNKGMTQLKILLHGYEGPALIGVNSEQYEVSGSNVEALGRFPEGTEVTVELLQKDPGYYCWPFQWHGLLVDISHTVIFSCGLENAIERPFVTSVSYSPEIFINMQNSLHITSISSTESPVMGYSLTAIEQPEGSTFSHDTLFSNSDYQRYSVDTVGTYTIEVRAFTASAISSPITITVQAIDSPPEIYNLSISPEDIYTETDVTASANIYHQDPSSVTLSYLWSVNGTPIPEITADTLPANYFTKGDTITLQARAENLNHTVFSNELSRSVLDSPAQLDASNIPQTLLRGSTLDIPLLLTDPDGDEPGLVSLKYGPAGMAIVDGRLQWHGNPILMSDRGLFRFGISLADGDSAVAELSIRVTENGRSTTTLGMNELTGTMLRRRDRVMDYDNDGIVEAIAHNDYSLSIIEIGDSVREQWALAAMNDVTSSTEIHDATFVPQQTGQAHLAVLTSSVLLVDTASGQFLAERPLPDISNFYSSIHYSAGEDPSAGTLVVMLASSNSSNNRRLIGLDPETLDTAWQSVSGNLGDVMMIANVDDDPQAEIVTTGGYVFDSSTGANQWLFGNTTTNSIYPLFIESLGYSLGVQNIHSNNMRVMDFNTRSSTTINLPAMSSAFLTTGNTDVDGNDEVVLLKTWEVLTYDYDVDSGLTLKSSEESASNSGDKSVVPNFTDDSKAAIVAVGYQGMYVQHFEPEPVWRALSVVGCQKPSRYTLANRASTSVQPTQTIDIGMECFSSPAMMVSLDVISDETTHQALPTNNLDLAITGLINNDANTDFVYTSSNTLGIYDAAIESAIWSISGLSQAFRMEALDINDDGSKEIVRTRTAGVEVYDLITQSLTAQILRPANSESIIESHAFTHPTTGDHFVVVSTPLRLQIYQVDSTGASLLKEIQPGSIYAMVLQDTNEDGSPEIILQRWDAGNYYLEIYDLDLNQIRRTRIAHSFYKLAAVPNSISQGSHLIGIGHGENYSKRLSEIDLRTGNVTWEGPSLLYSTTADSLGFVNSVAGARLVWANRHATVIGW